MTTTELPGAIVGRDAHSSTAPGPNFTDSQDRPELQLTRAVGESNLPATSEPAVSKVASSRAPQPPQANRESATTRHMLGDSTSDATKDSAVNQRPFVASDSTSPPARDDLSSQRGDAGGDPNFTDDQVPREDHRRSVVGEPNPGSGHRRVDIQRIDAAAGSTPTGAGQGCCVDHGCAARPGGFLRDPVLGVLSDVLDDFENVRIANANRVRILTRKEEDSDGETRGWGLTEEHPEVAKLLLTLKALESAEHDSVLNLQRALRKHPLVAVQKRYRGLGEKQFARMLATIGDPYWHDVHQRPRTVSELWAYCGLDVRGGEAPRRQRGQQSNWSEDARKRLYVISSSLVKGGRMADDKRGPQDPVADKYRALYDATKAKYADSVHPVDCKRCGPAGKPALAGSQRSAAHIHAIAIRAMSKELLKELWREARDIYAEEANA